jgi:hypothetical protein
MQSSPAQQTSARLTFVPWTAPSRPAASSEPRQMTPTQGRALETLAHAIEYLEDEGELSAAFFRSRTNHDELEAIATLKAASRNLWASLPAREPLWRRMLDRHQHATVVPLPLQ